MMARAMALHAAALQVADAHAEAADMADAFGGSVRASRHPTRGPREVPDEILDVIDLYQQRGQQPSPVTMEELAQLVQLEPRPWLLAMNEPDRLIADLSSSQPATSLRASKSIAASSTRASAQGWSCAWPFPSNPMPQLRNG